MTEATQTNGTQTHEEAPENHEDNKSGLVEASQGSLDLYQAPRLPQNRPIEPSHIQVVETYSIMGNRPVVASGMKIVDNLSVSGHRPVTASSLVISEQYSVMGNRPVASNEVEDMGTLIGYLD
ncbi:MAG: hypothetical protein SAJ12_04455 [Jaaginema sp. PMC 1079.18]|nr:hypothetical protein [Jaaginema sp. PMC 1080.18]MEC4850242.1 hypothetical protein [Jaaginema sp. PMC 1079.18]MEC4867294.1 hypothetical protein [Jaaginema sp. PMC 1078.18]